jgi:hypothetical protein
MKFDTLLKMALVSLPSDKCTDGHVGTIDHRRLKRDQDAEASSDFTYIYINPVSPNFVSIYNIVIFLCRFLCKNRISGSHGRRHEDGCLLGFSAV